MSSSEGSTHLPSPPGSGAQPPSDNAATPNTATAPFLPSSLFGGPLAASPFTTSYTPFQTVSSVSNTSSRASVKQHSRAEVVSRTVHLRCLPPSMKQRELADVFDLCGEYLRVRICGNAATHQKWVYGFVEFAKVEAVAVMLTHSGMELSNGADKPPLRLKCSPSKQPILDCMAYDADVVSGTPCGFGRGYLADCTLNDALLVVGSSGVAAAQTGSASGGGAKNNGKSGGASGGGGRRAAANRALTALTISSIRKTAATGCGCGCSGVNCCDCCRCWKGEKAEGGEEKGAAAAVGGGCCGGGGGGGATATTATVTTGKSDEGGLTTATTELLTRASFAEAPATDFTKTSATFADLTLLPSSMNVGELDVMQQLAAAFQGLRTTAAAEEGPLDGPAMVRRAETMALDALTRASHLSSDTRIQDILCDLGQLLSFLDGGAAVTGGAAQTASGDCTATLPQRVTQLRMLANLVGALLCLLRRSVADAVPYVEAVLVTFAQIPPSSLLLRARQHEREVRAAAKPGGDATKTNAKDATVAGGGAPAPLFDLGGESKRTGDTTQGLGFAAFALGAFSDEDVADGLLDMVDEDDDIDDDGHVSGDGCSPHAASGSRACTDGEEAPERHTCSKASAAEAAHQRQLLNGSRSASLSSDESVAFLNSVDMVDLCRRDEAFTRYILNVVVSIGIAMESVQPMIARSAYTLANTRAAEVLTEPSAMVAACLAACAASPASPPRLCETLFKEAGSNGKARDITFFPHRFFESVAAMRQKVKDTRGTECFWRQLPPNHVVPLYKF